MGTLSLLVVSLMSAGPLVDATTLDNEHVQGELIAITADAIEINPESSEQQSVALNSLLEIRFLENKPTKESPTTRPTWIELVDGSRLNVEKFQANVRQLTANSPLLGNVEVELSQVRNIRLADNDSRVEERWQELCDRDHSQDRLVIRKQDVLNFIPGTLGAIDGEKIQFELDGRTASVKQAKVFGIILGRRNESTGQPLCRVFTHQGGELAAKSLKWNDERIQLELVSGSSVSLPVQAVASLDFSLGKVRYLSQMQPREVKYTPFFDVTWKYQRDANLDGGPLRVGDKEYRRGLSIHSKTYLRYRLGTEYRRFRAIMGIDRLVGKQGNVEVIITADGNELWKGQVRGSDPEPHNLDLEVSGMRELEILVDFGGDLDIADHLDLADARLIK